MSQINRQDNNAPSMMLIMRSVAEVAGMTSADIIDGSRRAGLCHARAAVYKIATLYGYSREEIMFFVDRNRTVAYNYEANLKGCLSTNTHFKALCAAATTKISKYPHRVETSQQKPPEEPTAAIPEIPGIEVPDFTDWKGKLGWTFTAEQCRREWYAKRAAAEFMKHYGRQPRIHLAPSSPQENIPADMTTAEASLYLGVSPGILVRGVQLGKLRRFRKPHDTSYWFYTEELDRFRSDIAQNKRLHPKFQSETKSINQGEINAH